MKPILVRVVRPLFFKGKSYAAAETIEADPLGAHELTGSGRAVLADPADAPRVQAAVAESCDRLMRKLDQVERQRAAANWVRRAA